MSTETLPAVAKPFSLTYVPLGEKTAIELTVDRVQRFLCVPTKSGKRPTTEQVIQYMMLCQAQSLNPWVRDAYLVGYDSKDGPSFSLITSHQAILKRAEASDQYDGMESGLVVKSGDTITDRPGKILYEGEKILGGWCRVYRKDRRIPAYDSIQLNTYNTGRSRWAVDPAGMIVKVAEAAALRKSYPSNLAALYCEEEMDHTTTGQTGDRPTIIESKPVSRVEQVKQQRQSSPVKEQPSEYPESGEQTMAVADPINDFMEADTSIPVEKIDALRKAVKAAWPKATTEERLALYKSWGIEDPSSDDSYDLFGIETAWAAIEAQNEATRE